MQGVPLSALEPDARAAFETLRDELASLLGDDLVALWAYGAAVFPEPPARLGDLEHARRAGASSCAGDGCRDR